MEKTCPMTFNSHPANGQVLKADCLEDKCAWWDPSIRLCVVHGLFRTILVKPEK
jgi:hypothetical protein